MLKKIIKIENVGAIRAGVGKPQSLARVTLVYADNGRGKSTFSALLSAAGTRDAESVIIRKSIGTTDSQYVNLLFNEGESDFNVTFDGKNWQGRCPNIYVFNQDFVERNVYAGTEVTERQRTSLLDLALGDEAVAAQTELRELQEISGKRADDVLKAEGQLLVVNGHTPLQKYIELPPIPNVDEKIRVIEKLIADALDVNSILKMPIFSMPAYLRPIDADKVRAIWASTLKNVQVEAEALVKEHLAAHRVSEQWIHDGFSSEAKDSCPFCGQATNSLPLLNAYNDYFSEAYTKLKDSIDKIGRDLEYAVSDDHISAWKKVLEYNREIEGRWNKHFQFELPMVNLREFSQNLQDVRSALREPIEAKKSRPLDAVDEKLVNQVLEKFSAVVDVYARFQEKIEAINSAIETHRNQLAGEDVAELERERQRLRMHWNRYQPKVILLVESIRKAHRAREEAIAAETTAKSNLEILMATLLEKFQSSINSWLANFGAQFSIEKMDASKNSGTYVIKVRGASVLIGTGKGDLNFRTALSEGDKRTLAFSFFLAKLFSDPKRSHATVVLDDVFTSLDQQRRYNTTSTAIRIADECSQLIVFGHDAHFLRELWKQTPLKKLGKPETLCLHRDAYGNSIIMDFSIDDYCASAYYTNYLTVENFLRGELPPGGLLAVAIALRPLVEGHLHKSFPKRFDDGLTFGQMIDHINNAQLDNPISSLKRVSKELAHFNHYAGSFHHDTAGGHPQADVNDGELKHMAQGALKFIQLRTLWGE